MGNATGNVGNASPTVGQSKDLRCKVEKLERVKGIEPSYSAWKAGASTGFRPRIPAHSINQPTENKAEIPLPA